MLRPAALILSAALAFAQTAPTPAPLNHSIRIALLSKSDIEQRLQRYNGDDDQREQALKQMFEAAGCKQLTEQPVKGHKKTPNVICTLPGDSQDTIIVGAHFDHVDRGAGVVDNWSGASLLPSMYQAVAAQPKRTHTYLFIGFAAEELGEVGSREYVKAATPQDLSHTKAVVIMDTLGIGPTEVWASRSNKDLVNALARIAATTKLPISAMNVDKVGESDEEPFIEHKIPTITVHSITPATWHILHTAADKWDAIKLDDYYDSYRLLSTYIAYLDQAVTQH